MPLPWLIGAAVVAVGATVVAALSDDDKPSNNSNNDDEERRRRAAERERKERERNEKKAMIKQEFDQQVQQAYKDMKTSLPDFIIVRGIGQSNLTLSSNGSNFYELESGVLKNKMLSHKFMQDLDLFKQLYAVDVKPTGKMISMTKDIDSLKSELDKLNQLIKALS